MARLLSDNQISLFDFMDGPSRQDIYPQTIQKLHDKLVSFYGDNISSNSYRVWEHIPNLGLRYEAWIYIDGKENEFGFFDKIVEEFKPYKLEVSVNYMPSFSQENKISVMVSTIWRTPGHKER